MSLAPRPSSFLFFLNPTSNLDFTHSTQRKNKLEGQGEERGLESKREYTVYTENRVKSKGPKVVDGKKKKKRN